MNNQEQKIQELENKNQELTKKLDEFSNKFKELDGNKEFQLHFPLDIQSSKVIRDLISEEIFNIVWDDYYYYSTTFESIDRYYITGTAAAETINSEGLYFETLGTGANEGSAILYITSDLISVQREARFQISNKVSSVTNVNWAAYILEDALATSHVGFNMTNGIIYGISEKAGTGTSVELGSYIANTFYKLELYFSPSKITFFVNDIEKGVITDNIPIAVPTRLLDTGIGETSASARSSTTSYFNFIQKKQ